MPNPRTASGDRIGAARARGMSLSVKLPLFIGALIAVVIGTDTLGDYRNHVRDAREAAAQRLNDVADEWVLTYSRSSEQLGDRLAPVAANRDVAAYLAAGRRAPSRTRVRVMSALRSVAGSMQTVAVELWDPAGRVLLTTGNADAFRRPPLDSALLRAARGAAGAVIGGFRAVGDSLAYPVVARVRTRAAVRGFVVHWLSINTSPAGRQQVSMLIGSGGRIFVGNARDSVWTDLATRATPPPVDVSTMHGVVEYRRRAGPMLAVGRLVPSTPWSVVVEFPVDSVTTPARRAVAELLVVDAIVLFIGLFGAWLVSRSLVARLTHLTTAAEAMGTVGAPLTQIDAAAGDEITRLGVAFDAMARRVADALAARRASEEQYRGLFESVPLPLYLVDLETLRFVAVNQALIDRYGYTRDEFAQFSLHDIRPAEDVPKLDEELRRLGEEPSDHGVWRHRLKDGSLIDVEVIAHRCMFNGRAAVLCLANDVTARNRAARAIQRSEERYRTLIRESPYGIALSTPAGTLIEVNPALLAMLGYDSPADIVGTSVRDLYVDADARAAIADELRDTGACRRDALQWKRRDGRLITVRFSARLVPASRDTDAYVEAIIEDVTERLRMEEQFHQAQRMEAVGRLAGGIAHDFNNLLTVILTTTELLLDSDGPEGPQHAELQDVYRSAQRGAELTRQLLAFSRRQVLTMQPLSMNALIAQMESLLRRLLGNDIRLRVVPGTADDIVRADPTQLEQVLLNLAVNSGDAMPQGGQLSIETAAVEVGDDGNDGGETSSAEPMAPGIYVRVIVTDSGEGMPVEVRDHAFEPFFTTKSRDKGTGLGLATVYGIVKQLGGYVWVTSEVGRGTTFRIYLPRVADAAREVAPDPSRRIEARGTETILVAEDEDAIRRLLARVLTSRGYTVLAEASGEAALLRAEGHPERIDLLVSDVVMAGITGPELAERLTGIHPETIPLFLSGYTDEAMLKFGVAAGKVAFLQKPFTHQAFLAKVREALDHAKA